MKRKSGRYGARSTKRRRVSGKPKTINTRVNKILRFIKQNKPETKKAFFKVTGVNLTGGMCTTWNLMERCMAVGAGDNQFVGKSFNLKGISIKLTCNNESSAGGLTGYSAADQKHVISVIGHKEYYALSSIPIAQIAATEYGTFSTYIPQYDGDKVKIYKQAVIHHRGIAPSGIAVAPYLPDQNGGHARTYTRKLWIPMNRKITFERYSTDYKIKGLNLYLLAQSDYTGPSYTYYGRFNADVTLYYTDD